MSALKQAAEDALDLGFRIFPLQPKSKLPYPGSNGFKDASFLNSQIDAWWHQEPESNIGIALGESNLCVLDFDKLDGVPDWVHQTRTLKVRTSKGLHVYFYGSRKTGKMYRDGEIIGDIKSEGGYVLAAGSVHPDGPIYTIIDKSPIAKLPDISQLEKSSPKVPIKPGDRIAYGNHDNWLTMKAGELRHAGLSEEMILPALIDLCETYCDSYETDYVSMCEKIAHSIGKKEAGPAYTVTMGGKLPGQSVTANRVSVPESVGCDNGVGATTVKYDLAADMPEAVLDGRLGEIYQRRLSRFPIAYGWPALIAAAGVMVPVVEPTATRIGEEPLTTFFTGLVGPVHSGKSQAILWANAVIGLPTDSYSNVKAGSSEGLLRKLNKMKLASVLKNAALIDLDEWKFLFNKAGIDNSSFTSFLQTAFYNRRHNTTLSRGQEVEFDCALSFVGGIVQDEFEDCFGANSMGGLHDRFTFGLCPEGYNFMYRPIEGLPEPLNPIPVTIDGDVFEMIEGVRKADPKIGREAEIAVRVAHTCAAFDGRAFLHAQDCETSIRAFIAEQVRIRQLLQPNEGITNDAVMSNALVRWLTRKAGNLEIVPERDVHRGLKKTLDRLGWNVLDYATRSLQRQGIIWHGDLPGGRIYAGRPQRAYQLLKPEQQV